MSTPSFNNLLIKFLKPFMSRIAEHIAYCSVVRFFNSNTMHAVYPLGQCPAGLYIKDCSKIRFER